MNLVAAAVLLVLSSFACAFPLDLPKNLGSVYLFNVFLPHQEESTRSEEIVDNRIDAQSYKEIDPLQRIVIAYSPPGNQFDSSDYDQVASHEESVHDRQRRSPVAGRRGGGGGGRGGGGGGGRGGGGGSSGSWSQASSSASSGSSGSGRGGGRGGGRGQGNGK